jgi:hypothetical protein
VLISKKLLLRFFYEIEPDRESGISNSIAKHDTLPKPSR